MATGHKTRLRVLRRDIRTELGTTRDPVPSVEQLLEALAHLGAMLDLASGGAYGVAVYEFKTGQHLSARSVKTARRQKAEAFRRFSAGEITRTELETQERTIDAWLASTHS